MHAPALDLFMSVLHAAYTHPFELSLSLGVVPWEIVAAMTPQAPEIPKVG